MIERIKALFRERGPDAAESGDGPRPTAKQKHFAAAALMIEAARADGDFDAEERNTVSELVERHFDISGAEAEALIAGAEAAQDDANHLLGFTRDIKESFSLDERVEVIEMLWEVAYADGVLHHYEANLLRRVGGLIYVSDRDRGAARKRVLERLGIAPEAQATPQAQPEAQKA
jgi:uncharacterized tellurite resistance protein B-like protein